jgi:hypothetical protein
MPFEIRNGKIDCPWQALFSDAPAVLVERGKQLAKGGSDRPGRAIARCPTPAPWKVPCKESFDRRSVGVRYFNT